MRSEILYFRNPKEQQEYEKKLSSLLSNAVFAIIPYLYEPRGEGSTLVAVLIIYK